MANSENKNKWRFRFISLFLVIILLTIVSTSSVYGTVPSADMFLQLDSTHGVTDLTGNFTPFSVATVTCSGQSCNFDGDSGLVDTGYDVNGLDQFAMFCWASNDDWTSTQSLEHIVAARNSVGGASPTIRWDEDPDDMDFDIITDGTLRHVDMARTSASNTFSLYTLVKNSTHWTQWINTTIGTPTAEANSLQANTANLSIGAIRVGDQLFWDGNITRCYFSQDGDGFTQADVNEVYALGETASYTNFVNLSTPPIFSLTLQDAIDLTSITNFSAEIDNGTDILNITTTNGTINFGTNQMINITVFNVTNYYNTSKINHNTSSNLVLSVIPYYTFQNVIYDNYTTFAAANYTRTLNISANITCRENSNTTFDVYINDSLYKTNNVSCLNEVSFKYDFSTKYANEGNYSIYIVFNNSVTTKLNQSWAYFVWDLNNPNAYLSYSVSNFNPVVNMSLNCTDSIMNQTEYNLSTNSNTLYHVNASNGTLFYNNTALTETSNTVYGTCKDLFGSTINQTTFSAFFSNITLINEQTGLAFDVTNLTTAKMYLTNLTYFDLKDAGTGNLSFGSTVTPSFWIELSNDGGTIIRYFDVSLFDGNIKICANFNTVQHYEQLFIAATEKVVKVRNTFSDCYVIGEYTQFAYQDALSIRGFSIEGFYDLSTISSGQDVLLASIDGGVASYRNLDTLEFSQNAYSYSIQDQYAEMQKYGNETIQIYYKNQENDSIGLTLNIYDAGSNSLLYTKNDFTDPNEFTFYWYYGAMSYDNNTLFKFDFIRTDSSNVEATLTKYTSIFGKQGLYPVAVGVLLSLVAYIIGLTSLSAKSTFGWFGIIMNIAAIVLLSLAVNAWYVNVLMVYYWLSLVTLILVYISANRRGVLQSG